MENTTMKKLILFVILTGLVLGLTGCQSKEDKKEAERKAKREYMLQHVDTKSGNTPIRLP
jgi:ABC-type oligopeptide transport system substrate-binding subunit